MDLGRPGAGAGAGAGVGDQVVLEPLQPGTSGTCYCWSEGLYWLETLVLLWERERDLVPSLEDMLSRVVFRDSTCSISSRESCCVPSSSRRPLSLFLRALRPGLSRIWAPAPGPCAIIWSKSTAG